MSESVEIAPSYDAVVIGAGMGGLSAAGHLARAGLRVGLFEKHSKLGGYAQYFGKELTFDSATHLLSGCGEGGWLHSALEPLGVLERVEFVCLNAGYRAMLPGHDLLVPPDAEALRQELSVRFPAEATGLARFFTDAAAMGGDYLSLARGEPGNALIEKYRFKTAAQLLADYTRDPALQALLTALWPLNGLPPASLSALQFASFWHTYHQQGGTCFVRGGMRAFGQALAVAITGRGGTVATHTPVRRILVNRGRAAGVELEDGRRVACGRVVMNGNPHDLYEQLLGGGERQRHSALDGTVSISAMQVFLTVEMPLDLPARTTVYQTTETHEDSFTNLQRGEPEFSSVVVSVLTHSDPDRAPAGQHMVVLMALQPYSRPDWWHVPEELRRGKAYRILPEYLELKERLGDRLVATAEAVIPGLSQNTLARKVGTPITMERYTFNTGGAAFGWANIPQQVGTMRPGPETPLRGLYQAGHWSFPGSGVSAALVSGRLAAEAALREN